MPEVQESEGEGFIIIRESLGTPASLLVAPLPASPSASAFYSSRFGAKLRKGPPGQSHRVGISPLPNMIQQGAWVLKVTRHTAMDLLSLCPGACREQVPFPGMSPN